MPSDGVQSTMSCLRVLVPVTLLLLVVLVQLSTAQTTTDFALNQPAYQLEIWGNHVPTKAVNGNSDRYLSSGSCSHSGGITNNVHPWWTVQLSKWILLTSFVAIGRGDWAEWRDYGYSFYVGGVWNDSYPSVVASGSMTTDPLQDWAFSRIYTFDATLSSVPALNVTMNKTDVFVGRYFTVQPSWTGWGQLVILCQIQVFGTPSVLSGRDVISIVSDYAPYSSYNSSLLTDEKESTCVSFFGAVNPDAVILQPQLAAAGKTQVVVLMRKGNVTVDTTISATCAPVLFLKVAMQRQNRAYSDYSCSLVETHAYTATTLYSFTCDCSACTPDMSVSLESNNAGYIGAVDVCEVLVFPRS